MYTYGHGESRCIEIGIKIETEISEKSVSIGMQTSTSVLLIENYCRK